MKADASVKDMGSYLDMEEFKSDVEKACQGTESIINLLKKTNYRNSSKSVKSRDSVIQGIVLSSDLLTSYCEGIHCDILLDFLNHAVTTLKQYTKEKDEKKLFLSWNEHLHTDDYRKNLQADIIKFIECTDKKPEEKKIVFDFLVNCLIWPAVESNKKETPWHIECYNLNYRIANAIQKKLNQAQLGKNKNTSLKKYKSTLNDAILALLLPILLSDSLPNENWNSIQKYCLQLKNITDKMNNQKSGLKRSIAFIINLSLSMVYFKHHARRKIAIKFFEAALEKSCAIKKLTDKKDPFACSIDTGLINSISMQQQKYQGVTLQLNQHYLECGLETVVFYLTKSRYSYAIGVLKNIQERITEPGNQYKYIIGILRAIGALKSAKKLCYSKTQGNYWFKLTLTEKHKNCDFFSKAIGSDDDAERIVNLSNNKHTNYEKLIKKIIEPPQPKQLKVQSKSKHNKTKNRRPKTRLSSAITPNHDDASLPPLSAYSMTALFSRGKTSKTSKTKKSQTRNRQLPQSSPVIQTIDLTDIAQLFNLEEGRVLYPLQMNGISGVYYAVIDPQLANALSLIDYEGAFEQVKQALEIGTVNTRARRLVLCKNERIPGDHQYDFKVRIYGQHGAGNLRVYGEQQQKVELKNGGIVRLISFCAYNNKAHASNKRAPVHLGSDSSGPSAAPTLRPKPG